MKPLHWGLLLGLGAAGVALGVGLSMILVGLGHHPLQITGWMGVLFALIAAVLWYWGRGVRALKRREETKMTPIQAARVAALSRSTAINGAWFSGFLLAVSVFGLTRTWAPAMLSSAIGAGIAGIGAIAMTVVAWIVERWCIDDPDSKSDEQRSGGNSGRHHERGAHGTACIAGMRGEGKR